MESDRATGMAAGVGRLMALFRAIVAGLGLVVAAQVHAVAAPYSGIVVFGDSLADSGNVYFATGNTVPIAPPYFNGRFSNGPNFADALAGKLGFALSPSLLPGQGIPFPNGTNFAWGGANSGPAVLPVGGLMVPPIYRATAPGVGEYPSQLQLFGLTLPPTGADPNALYVLWGGGNDLRDAVKYAKDHPGTALGDGAAVVDAAIGYLQGALATLDAMGARHVLVPNLPNIGLTPETRDWDTNPMFSLRSYATALTGNFNVRLQGLISGFGGLDIIPFDTYSFFNEIQASPGTFGLTNTTDPCLTTGEASIYVGGTVCTAPGEMLYWDNHHPGATIHAALAERMFAAAVPEPKTFVLMLVGLAGLVVVARRRARRA